MKPVSICKAKRGDLILAADGRQLAVVDFLDSSALRATIDATGKPWSWHFRMGIDLTRSTLPIPTALRKIFGELGHHQIGAVLTVERP